MTAATLLLVLPAVTALLLALLPASALRLIHSVALAGALATLALALSLLGSFDTSASAVQYEQRLPWVPEIGVSFHVGLDGLSFPMVLLTCLLAVVALLASMGPDKPRGKGYFAWFLAMEVAILGVFVAQDWFLFYVFWELALIPMFFLIGVWGDEKRGAASMAFFLYTLAGSILMLVGMMAAYLATPEHSFDMSVVAQAHSGWSSEFQIFVFCLFFAGMAVKLPVVPLHGWLPMAHVQAPVPVSMMLSGVLLKMGAYGMLRLLDLAPAGAQWATNLLFGAGLVSIVYGAFMAWKQDDLKAMVAYSSISHMGFVLVGIASLSEIGLSGAMTQMFVHGIITAALFMLVGVIYENAHSRKLSELAGAARGAPRYMTLLTMTLLAAIGLPGLAGFVGEFHVLVGAYERWGTWVGLAGVGILVTSGYCLRMFGRVYISPGTGKATVMADLNLRQIIALVPLVLLMLALGLHPAAIMELSATAIGGLSVLK